ncbi:MAG: hypothetical protein PVF15_05975 [Candidatus Bathyarchaeota archaeon]|jgi:hypothetical protein
MLSFEISVIDIVLVVAIIILLSFHLTRTSYEPSVKKRFGAERRKSVRKPENPVSEISSKRRSSEANEKNPPKCPFHLGYLNNIRKEEGSIPEECYKCTQMMQCSFSTEKSK